MIARGIALLMRHFMQLRRYERCRGACAPCCAMLIDDYFKDACFTFCECHALLPRHMRDVYARVPRSTL